MSVDESTLSIVYAMLDSGSDQDIVTPELAKKLGLVQRAKSVTIQTVVSNMTSNRLFADLRVKSIDEVYSAGISGALICSLLTSNEDAPPLEKRFRQAQPLTRNTLRGSQHFGADDPGSSAH